MILTHEFDKALLHAARVHAGQLRKKTEIPYLAHPLGVASIALEYGATETEAIAALLHDAVEDGGGRPEYESILQEFGAEVAEIVDGCTDTYEDPKPPWKIRKEEYIGRLRKESQCVCLVSVSDKLHNARAILKDFRRIGDEVFERFEGKKADTLWYYRELVEVFREKGFHEELVKELDRVVSEIERLANPPKMGN